MYHSLSIFHSKISPNLWTKDWILKCKRHSQTKFQNEKLFSCSLSPFELLFVAFENAVEISCWLKFDWIRSGILILCVCLCFVWGALEMQIHVIEGLNWLFSFFRWPQNLIHNLVWAMKADWHQLPLLLVLFKNQKRNFPFDSLVSF